LVSEGIIDPTKVVRTALQDAVDCWPANHYRGDGRRETQEGDTDACHARWRHGWHGLLIDAEPVLPGRGLGRLLGPSFLTRPSQTMSRVAAIVPRSRERC